MTRRASLDAQAKVNLFLRVLARESNGYHQLETLFCRLSLADRVTVTATAGDRSLRLSGPELPASGLGPKESNLAWKAAALFQSVAGWPNGWAIEIEKQIPVGAGLGGGSADAGAVLRALNALAPEPLGASSLLQLAAKLGADVPFLTQDVTPLALAWGRGERMLALPPLPPLRCAVHKPDFAISTAEAYGWLKEVPLPPTEASVLSPEELGTWDRVAGMAENAFEPVVFARFPTLGGLLGAASSRGAQIARMSGSGSALFALGPDPVTYFPSAVSCQTAERVASIAVEP